MTAAGDQATSDRFSAALKAMTWDEHEQAESTGFIRALLGGRLSLDAYTDMVAQHYFAYLVLEEAGERMRDDPIGGRFVFGALRRVAALEADLEHLLGPLWRDGITPSASTTDYCHRLREVCFDWPGGYVAHSYTRYLGDLSGGRAIYAALRRAFPEQTDGDHGVRFYVFPGIPDHDAFKADYRHRLDTAPWADGERQRVIDEAVLAYKLNTRVLAELGRDLPRYQEMSANHRGDRSAGEGRTA